MYVDRKPDWVPDLLRKIGGHRLKDGRAKSKEPSAPLRQAVPQRPTFLHGSAPWGSNYPQFSGFEPLVRGSNLLNCR